MTPLVERRSGQKDTINIVKNSTFWFLLLVICFNCTTAFTMSSVRPKPISSNNISQKHVNNNVYNTKKTTLLNLSYNRKGVKQSKLFTSAVSTETSQSSTLFSDDNELLSPLMSTITRIGMMLYIVGMCIALPLTLYPQKLIYKLGITTQVQKEKFALSTGRFCARWLLRLIPFCNVECIVDKDNNNNDMNEKQPQPTIWVCNHTSMLDVFILLASDRKLRGKYKRPIKIIYWKSLEDNPVTKILFTMSGFIPVSMVANAPGEDNQYDKASFKKLLKSCKDSFDNGFDVAILPEGQLNPTPELGLLPTFSGAYTLAKMSKRPIQMMSLYNTHNLWHPVLGMIAKKRNIKLRNYILSSRNYNDSNDFKYTFETVVGYFGKTGKDINNVQDYLSGKMYNQQKK